MPPMIERPPGARRLGPLLLRIAAILSAGAMAETRLARCSAAHAAATTAAVRLDEETRRRLSALGYTDKGTQAAGVP